MTWIVIGEEKGKVKLVSGKQVDGILPKGSYLTIDDNGFKTILRVDESHQIERYNPTPLVIDMDLGTLEQEQRCQNIILATRLGDFSGREDGLLNYIRPQTKARRSTQEEINHALGSPQKGPQVFLATIQSCQNQLLRDGDGNPITVRLNEEMFYHQILICGKTGSGKTVANKYLAQYFTEEMKGAALLINVKEFDFLKMDRPSMAEDAAVRSEWASIKVSPHGVRNFVVYYPATSRIDARSGVNLSACIPITLDVKKIDPDSLVGLLQNISDVGALSLPDIFRYWLHTVEDNGEPYSFNDFVDNFNRAEDTQRTFTTMNQRGDMLSTTLHPSTYHNIKRSLSNAAVFFDNKDARSLEVTDILSPGKMSVIDVTANNAVQFGSILLRDILHKIVEARRSGIIDVPILIVIDEVHKFYGDSSSMEALGELDTICRTGRSQHIGVVFSSQNPSDMPQGLASVVNTKIFFKSDQASTRIAGFKVSDEELEMLRKGYAIAAIHEMSQVKAIKFPLALAGVGV